MLALFVFLLFIAFLALVASLVILLVRVLFKEGLIAKQAGLAAAVLFAVMIGSIIGAASTDDETEAEEQEAAEAAKKSTDTAGTTDLIPVELVKTIEGDTIKIICDGKEVNVRYLLTDTPDTNHPQLGKQPFGEEAKERNRQLVNSDQVPIEFDVEHRYDKYDRLLAYVYVDGQDVQKNLIEESLARVSYVYPPNTRHLTPYEEAQASAKAKGIGIWSIENYATESGFNGNVPSSSSSDSSPAPASRSTSGSSSSPETAAPAASSSEEKNGSRTVPNCGKYIHKVCRKGIRLTSRRWTGIKMIMPVRIE